MQHHQLILKTIFAWKATNSVKSWPHITISAVYFLIDLFHKGPLSSAGSERTTVGCLFLEVYRHLIRQFSITGDWVARRLSTVTTAARKSVELVFKWSITALHFCSNSVTIIYHCKPCTWAGGDRYLVSDFRIEFWSLQERPGPWSRGRVFPSPKTPVTIRHWCAYASYVTRAVMLPKIEDTSLLTSR